MGIESGQLEIIYRFVARIGVSYTARGVCQRSVNGCAPLDPGKMGESDAQDGIRIRVDGVTGRHDYSRALYQSELRRVSALIMLAGVVIKRFAESPGRYAAQTLSYLYYLR